MRPNNEKQPQQRCGQKCPYTLGHIAFSDSVFCGVLEADWIFIWILFQHLKTSYCIFFKYHLCLVFADLISSLLLPLICSGALLLTFVSDPGLLAAPIRLDYVMFCFFFCMYAGFMTTTTVAWGKQSLSIVSVVLSLCEWAESCRTDPRCLTYTDTPPAVQHLDAANQKPMYTLACIFYYSHLI